MKNHFWFCMFLLFFFSNFSCFLYSQTVKTTCDGALSGSLTWKTDLWNCLGSIPGWTALHCRVKAKQIRKNISKLVWSDSDIWDSAEVMRSKSNLLWGNPNTKGKHCLIVSVWRAIFFSESCYVALNMLKASESAIGIEVRRYLENLVAKKRAAHRSCVNFRHNTKSQLLIFGPQGHSTSCFIRNNQYNTSR